MTSRHEIINRLIENYCIRDDLESYDPYDIWKSKIGYFVKKTYNYNKYIGLPFAAVLSIFDLFINNSSRFFYSKQEYPIVRSLSALTLLNHYEKNNNKIFLDAAIKHIDWLVKNPSSGYSGFCWGINFKYPVSKGLIYDENTPFATITPYALEAMHRYTEITQDNKYIEEIRSIYLFLTNDLCVMYEDKRFLATSYGPKVDRIVTNSLSYTMYAFALLSSKYLSGEEIINAKQSALKIYEYIVYNQGVDGSWMYSLDGSSFIDCFHSCFVVKNIIKANKYIPLKSSNHVIENGYNYIKKEFLDKDIYLFKRFSLSNKYNLIKFDLYDNAEILSLSLLVGDTELAESMFLSINKNFIKGNDVFSQIDILNYKRNKNMLRWAVMPMLYAFSKMNYDK